MNQEEVQKVLGKRPCLLIIDVQHDFIDADGAVPCPVTSTSDVDEMVSNVKKLVDAAQAAKIPTIFTKEVHRRDMKDMGRELDGDEPEHCLEGTKGATILDEVLPGEQLGERQYLVQKRRYSAFVNTDIMTLLSGHNIDTIILTGAATNVCVHYTGADAHQLDFKIKVVEEATAGSSKKSHEAALVALDYLQHGARVSIYKVLEAMKNFQFPH